MPRSFFNDIPKDKIKVNYSINKDVFLKFKEKSQSEGRLMSYIVEQAIIKYLNNE